MRAYGIEEVWLIFCYYPTACQFEFPDESYDAFTEKIGGFRKRSSIRVHLFEKISLMDLLQVYSVRDQYLKPFKRINPSWKQRWDDFFIILARRTILHVFFNMHSKRDIDKCFAGHFQKV